MLVLDDENDLGAVELALDKVEIVNYDVEILSGLTSLIFVLKSEEIMAMEELENEGVPFRAVFK
jgi:hypothetical protein